MLLRSECASGGWSHRILLIKTAVSNTFHTDHQHFKQITRGQIVARQIHKNLNISNLKQNHMRQMEQAISYISIKISGLKFR